MTARIVFPLLAAALAVSGCNKEPSAATVTRRDVEGFLVIGGSLVTPPTEFAQVLPPYRAPVQQIMVSPGQWVRDGEVLMTLSFPGAEASYEQARQYVSAAEASYNQARDQLDAEVERIAQEIRALRARRDAGEDVAVQLGILENEMAHARRSLEANMVPYKQQLDQARQYLRDAQAGVKQASVRAPISGTVLEVFAQAGQVVGEQRDDPVATICDLAALIVHAPLTPEQAGALEEKMAVVLTFEGLNEEFEGTVTRIATRPGDDGITYLAVINFDNEKGLVKPGAEVKAVAIRTGEVEDVLAVPIEAVDTDSSGKPVVKVLRGSEWMPTVVEVGLSGAGYTEIKSGLKEGETVQVTP
jgi:RND family efflux transporter MFP subunit